MFSANQTISPSGLKNLVVAKGRRNEVGHGGTGSDGGNGIGWGRTGPRMGSDGGSDGLQWGG